MANLTTSFLLPMLKGVDLSLLQKNKVEAYLGLNGSWGKNIILCADPANLSQDLLSMLERHEQNVYSFLDKKKNTLCFVFKILDKDMEEIVKPFIAGKYTRIRRDYVNKYFHEKILDPKTKEVIFSINYAILTGSDWLRNSWEQKLDVYIEPGSELYDRPNPFKETYTYDEPEKPSKQSIRLRSEPIYV